MERSGKETEELVMDTKHQDKVVKSDDNVKLEDIEGLQRLRLVQEECNKPLIGQNEALKSAEEWKGENVCDAGDAKVNIEEEEVKAEVICNIDQTPKLDEEGEKNDDVVDVVRQSRKLKGVDNVGLDVKPALVRKEVGEVHGLTERQQKFLQDFHVKFVLEGPETDDSVHESGSSRHPEFLELKKRLEEEEEKYVRPTLPHDDEECDLDMNDTKSNNLIAVESPTDNSESSSRAGSVTDNSSRNCQKGKSCQLASTTTGLPESRDVKNATTQVANDGCGGLQGYNYCDEGKTRCHVRILFSIICNLFFLFLFLFGCDCLLLVTNNFEVCEIHIYSSPFRTYNLSFQCYNNCSSVVESLGSSWRKRKRKMMCF